MFSYPQEVSDFQVRRRRAAKLTSFFGVNYRELIEDILESIERGVEEEHGKGTLQLEEAEVSTISPFLNCFLLTLSRSCFTEFDP